MAAGLRMMATSIKRIATGHAGGSVISTSRGKLEPAHPYPPQDIRVVTVEPDALFLTPHHCVQPSDHKMLEAYHFTRPLQSIPPAGYSDGCGDLLSSKIILEFRALLSPTKDSPGKIFFRYTFKRVGPLRTPTGFGQQGEGCDERARGEHPSHPQHGRRGAWRPQHHQLECCGRGRSGWEDR